MVKKKAFNEIGECKLFPIEENFNIHSMANIIALKDLDDVTGFQITMNSSREIALIVDCQGKCYNLK